MFSPRTFRVTLTCHTLILTQNVHFESLHLGDACSRFIESSKVNVKWHLVLMFAKMSKSEEWTLNWHNNVNVFTQERNTCPALSGVCDAK